MAPSDPDSDDRGIGGTGVVGTIRRFGSIVVNDLRVTFPRSVSVRIDDRPARLSNLEIGHVVHVLAHRVGSRLSTQLIEAVSEVSGPVDAIGPDRHIVMGQTVIMPDAGSRRRWRRRDWVAVSGLRRLDGTIVASLIERCEPGVARIAGIPRLEPDGSAWVGGLALDGLPSHLVGQRLQVAGRLSDQGRLVVTSARPLWTDLLAGQPDRLSVEDYVALDEGKVHFGSGLPSAAEASVADLRGETRAVVSASVARSGQIEVMGIRAEGSSHGSGAPSPQRGLSPAENSGRPPGPSEASGVRRNGFGTDPGLGAGGRGGPPAGAPSAHGPQGPSGPGPGGGGAGGGHGPNR